MGSNASVAAHAPEPTDETKPIYPSQGPFWTADPKGRRPVYFSKEGPGSKEGFAPTTLTKVFEKAVAKYPNELALAVERPLPALVGKDFPPAFQLEDWKQWTFQQYFDESKKVAKAMIKAGMVKSDAVNIFGFNSPEWFMSQMAAIMVGGRAAGIYPSDTPAQFQFKSDHSNGAVTTVDNQKNFEKVSSQVDNLPYLKAVVAWDYTPSGDITRSDGSVVKAYTWEQFLALGESVSDEDLQQRIDAQEPEECCCLIYTSGTTGNPKAVMISHDSILFEAHTMTVHAIPHFGLSGQERVLSYLPLSHVAGMMVDIISPLVTTAYKNAYASVYFARPYDLKAGSFGDRLKFVKPTLFLGVPRVWEKIMEKLKAIGAKTTGLKKKLSTWAKAQGLGHLSQCQLGGSGHKSYSYMLAEKVVLSKIKAALGLQECKFAMTGAAPMTKECLEYFACLGIHINEVYGMSENSGAATVSSDECHIWGSCGFTFYGTEVKVFQQTGATINEKKEVPRCESKEASTDENQGEICFRGRHIMMGYMANPRLGDAHVKEIEKKNAGAIDNEGWLHSGDMGCMTTTGMLHITGRYKELIIGAGGENVAPVPIEDSVKKLCGAVSNIMMIGDKRKFNVALITLKAKGATGELPGGDDLDGEALSVNPDVTTISAAMDDPKMIEAITSAIKKTNADGSCCPSNASKIQKFMILPRDVSVETGELTATLKLKRAVVNKKFEKQIDSIYASKEVYVKYTE